MSRASRRRLVTALHWAPLGLLGLAFVAWPGLDLAISAALHDPLRVPAFFAAEHPLVRASYVAVPWLGRGALLAAAAVTLWPRPRAGRWRRRAALLLGVAVLANGAVVSWLLKDHGGRPRPLAVHEFGGDQPFVAALRPGGPCDRNCSFVSGHAATGYALMAVGLLSAPATRRRWTAAGLAAGTAIGVGRVLQGGHFASDVVFAAIVVGGVCALLRTAWLHARLRRRRRRLAPRCAT